MATVFVFSGAQVGYLRASVYQEVCCWAGAFAAIFVAAAIRGIVLKKFNRTVLVVMALMAGLSLLTRVSVAVGLFAALGLLLFIILAKSRFRDWHILTFPAAILITFVTICAYVNIQRWGNPTVFADYSLYNYNNASPDRLFRTQQYGLFNLRRIPLGIMYFFFPIWCVHGPSEMLLFDSIRSELLDAIELPPSSFLVTDALLVGLSGFAIRSRWSRRGDIIKRHSEKLAIGFGLSAAPILMLTAISMNYRYRMDFYPMIEFGAFLGMIALTKSRFIDIPATRRTIWSAVVISIVSSHLAMGLYRLSDLGPAQLYLKDGIVKYYYMQM